MRWVVLEERWVGAIEAPTDLPTAQKRAERTYPGRAIRVQSESSYQIELEERAARARARDREREREGWPR